MGRDITRNRPIFLNLFQIRFPIMAVVSIGHRMAGVVLFIGLPFLLWILEKSLKSPPAFEAACQFIKTPLGSIGLWVVGAAAWFHGLAGIRHLCMDLHWGLGRRTGRWSAYVVSVLFLLGVFSIGSALWPFGRPMA